MIEIMMKVGNQRRDRVQLYRMEGRLVWRLMPHDDEDEKLPLLDVEYREFRNYYAQAYTTRGRMFRFAYYDFIEGDLEKVRAHD